MIVALLMGATSCEMTDGETREAIDIGECIGRHTIELYECELHNFDDAIIADWYLSTEDEALRKDISNKCMMYENSFVTIDEDDTVRIQYNYHSNWNANDEVRTYMEFTTDGKLLSEGGVWSTTGTQEYRAKIIGNEDGTYSYILDNQNQGYKLTISDLKCDIQDGITYKVDGTIFHIDGDVESPKVILDTEITISLEYIKSGWNRSGFEAGGKIAVECDDRRIDRRDEVVLTFKKGYSVEVSYLGQVGTIKY